MTRASMDLTALLETTRIEAARGSEELRGFAVMSLPFTSGDVLCLRSWPASSFGPPYNAVWHRSAAGAWTVYHSVPAHQSCPRYVGAALSDAKQTPVRIEWIDPSRIRVTVDEVNLAWDLELGSTPITHLMNIMLALTPTMLFRSTLLVSMMGVLSTRMFDAGRVVLHGIFPNRQWFRAAPRRVWMVAKSRASFDGRDFGPPGALADQPTIGEVPLPQRGIFMVGALVAEAYSATRHLAWRRF